jgi:lysophospholipase
MDRGNGALGRQGKNRRMRIVSDFKPVFWQSTSGARLAVYRQISSDRAKAVIQINHGMAEHAERYERFARVLARAGYHSYAHDHRGHGLTTAPDAPLGTFARTNGLATAISDMKFVNDEIRQRHEGLPVILFGHSMGGHLGINYLIRHADTLDGAALWNFNVDGGALVSLFSVLLKIERMLKGSDVPSRLAMKMTFEDWNRKFKPNRTDFDWLSRDEAEVDKYVADPLCGFPVSVGMWLNVIEAIQTASNNSNLASIPKDLPVHLLGGEADPSSTFGKSMTRLADRLKRTGLGDVTCRTLKDTRHETLNEINRDEETSGFIKWLDERWG